MAQMTAYVREYADLVRDELESEEAEHDRTRWRLSQLESRCGDLDRKFRDIEALLWNAEMRRLSDGDVVAAIRGLLHK